MVTELLDAIVSWRTFLAALLVFGFVPGALLRLIVLAFRRDDPRRSELLAELHRVPRLERPFWVVEQLEVALSEGIWERVVWAATGRIIDRWHLGSGVKQNRKHPESFEIPDEEAKQAIAPGVLVKLMFDVYDGWGRWTWAERMWVEVVAVNRRHIVGTLRNQPIGIPRLDWGDQVKFKRDHVIDIDWEADLGEDCEYFCEDCEAEDLSKPPVGDPERDHIRSVHRGCNGLCDPATGDPELPPPPPESLAT
jgi:hypothetical protein